MTMTRDIQLSFHTRIERLRLAFSGGKLPRLMQAPPAVNHSASPMAGSLKTISPSNFGATGGFRYFGGTPSKLPYDGTDWVTLRSVSYAADGSSGNNVGGGVEFVTDAPVFEINLGGNGTPFRLLCEEDGEMRLVSGAVFHTDSSQQHLIIDFTGQSGVPTARRIRIELGLGSSFFAGVIVPTIHDVWRPTVANPLRCVVAGDSFTEGTTADGVPADIAGLSGYTNAMAWYLGLDDVWASGSGGTGWLQTNGERVALVDRFQRDVIDPAPDMAVVAMGVNDAAQAPSAIQVAVASCCQAFRTAVPTAPLFVVAPFSPQGADAPAVRAAVILGAQAENSGRTFIIDPRAPGREWQSTGSGTQGLPTGNGNGDWVVDAAGTHPTVAGHAYLGARLADAIREKLAA